MDNISVFAWKPTDMPDVPRHLIEHSLNISKTTRPIKQKLRRFARDKKEAIRKEVTRLLAAGFIKEVYHLDWLANPILVRKNNEWRMYVDYTNRNKHCPKDPFALPHIDEVVDSTAGCELLCFLDCYSSYHQISFNTDDQIKTSFITPFKAYCYTTMSFGLKNAGATYEIRDDQVEAYIDDVVMKTRDASTLIDNLDRTFKALNRYKWMLNPKKCIFGVPSSILLGNVISRDGISLNSSKVKAILDMRSSRNVKDVQKLTGCMAALSRFISRLGEKWLL